MRSVIVKGWFTNEEKQAIDGIVEFIPSFPWVDEDGETYPVYAPAVQTVKGYFECEITTTDSGVEDWYYLVRTPAGSWAIQVTEDEAIEVEGQPSVVFLKKLISGKPQETQ